MSTIKTETLSTPSNATVPVDTVVNGTAKAWVNFNGTGTVAIRRAFNVSSITDRGTGLYGVTFTTAMSDANYAVLATNGRGGWIASLQTQNSPNTTTGIYELRSCDASGTNQDIEDFYVAVFS